MLDLTLDPSGLFALGALPEHDPTRHELIFCQECGNWFQPDATWRCTCGFIAAFAIQPGICERCRGKCNCIRDGHRVRALCLCHETPEQRRLRLERDRRESEKLERERLALENAQRQRAFERAQGELATGCWELKQHACSLPANAYAYCRFCVRWRNQSRKTWNNVRSNDDE